MAKNTDFSQCEFIHQNMWFYTFDDFFENRFAIKKLFNELDRSGKRFYMWYVYANVRTNERIKNAIWNYLNDYDGNGIELAHLWRISQGK